MKGGQRRSEDILLNASLPLAPGASVYKGQTGYSELAAREFPYPSSRPLDSHRFMARIKDRVCQPPRVASHRDCVKHGSIPANMNMSSSRPSYVLEPLKTPSALVCVIALATSSAMLFWGTGLHPAWWLTWLAPVPVLLVSRNLSRRTAFLVAGVAWFVGSLNMWRYFLRALDMPLLLVIVFSVIPACLFGIGVLLFRRLIRQGALWKACLALPAFWVSLEYLNNVASRHGTFPNLGYTQMDFLTLVQLSSVVGIWGITFCVFLFAATASVLLSRPPDTSFPIRLTLGVTTFFVLVFGYGYWRLMTTPASEHSLKVGLIATGSDTTFPSDDQTALKLLRSYSERSEALVREGAQLVVLPEKIALVSALGTAQVDELYQSAAVRAGAPILVGLDRGAISKRWNEARLYFPDGRPAAVYDKHHMVPVFEDVDQPGTSITVITERSGTWGMEICKDMDFPGLSREYGRKGAGLLLVPAWDFTLDGWLHGRMAVMRGVENGFTIVRSAKQGLLTVSDDRGRILAQQDAAYVNIGTLLATAPVRHARTFYSRWGDWFAWLNVAGLVAILSSSWIGKRKTARAIWS